MLTCTRRGYLVDGTGVIPEDPTEPGVEGLPIVGCSRLVCCRCKAPVGNRLGGGARHYACLCTSWTERSQHPLEEPEREPQTDPKLPWTCAGHPALELPRVVDGEPIGSEAALRSVVARALGGWLPRAARAADGQWAAWLRRFYVRLAPAYARVVAEVAFAYVLHPDVPTRARAIAVFRTAHERDLLAHFATLLEEPEPRFAGVPDPISSVENETLEGSLWRALEPLLADTPALRRLARTAATTPGRASRALYDVLATHDAAWFVRETASMARANRAAVEVLCQAFAKFSDGAVIQAGRERARAAAADTVPRARTVSEMQFAASLVPCQCGARVDKLELAGSDDAWVLSGRCPGCGAPRSFQFMTEGNPRNGAHERLQLGDGRPSAVIHPGWFHLELQRLAPLVRDDVERIPLEDWAAQKALAERAYTAAVELAKFPGEARGPRERAIARLDAFAADAPRVWAARGPLHVSDELRSVVNQAGMRRRPTAAQLHAYLATRAGSKALAGASIREDAAGIHVELQLVGATDEDIADALLTATVPVEVSDDRTRALVHFPVGAAGAVRS